MAKGARNETGRAEGKFARGAEEMFAEIWAWGRGIHRRLLMR